MRNVSGPKKLRNVYIKVTVRVALAVSSPKDVRRLALSGSIRNVRAPGPKTSTSERRLGDLEVGPMVGWKKGRKGVASKIPEGKWLSSYIGMKCRISLPAIMSVFFPTPLLHVL